MCFHGLITRRILFCPCHSLYYLVFRLGGKTNVWVVFGGQKKKQRFAVYTLGDSGRFNWFKLDYRRVRKIASVGLKCIGAGGACRTFTSVQH